MIALSSLDQDQLPLELTALSDAPVDLDHPMARVARQVADIFVEHQQKQPLFEFSTQEAIGEKPGVADRVAASLASHGFGLVSDFLQGRVFRVGNLIRQGGLIIAVPTYSPTFVLWGTNITFRGRGIPPLPGGQKEKR